MGITKNNTIIIIPVKISKQVHLPETLSILFDNISLAKLSIHSEDLFSKLNTCPYACFIIVPNAHIYAPQTKIIFLYTSSLVINRRLLSNFLYLSVSLLSFAS